MAWAWHGLQATRHARQKRRGNERAWGDAGHAGYLFCARYSREPGGNRTLLRWKDLFWCDCRWQPPRDRSACDSMPGAAECLCKGITCGVACFGAFLGLGSGQMEVDVARPFTSTFLALNCLPACLFACLPWEALRCGRASVQAAGNSPPAVEKPTPAAEHFLPPTIDRIRLGTDSPWPACHSLAAACLPATQ